MKSFVGTTRWTTRTAHRAATHANCRLLVVDDYRPGAEALTAALSQAGYDARCVLGGPAALLAVAAQMPDIVVLDINMPGMDGYAVARILRLDVTAENLVIVAFTAQDEPAVRANGVAAGFDAYCKKGTAPEPLLRLIEQIK